LSKFSKSCQTGLNEKINEVLIAHICGIRSGKIGKREGKTWETNKFYTKGWKIQVRKGETQSLMAWKT